MDTQKEIIYKKKADFFSLAMKQSIDSDMSGGESGGGEKNDKHDLVAAACLAFL